MDYAQNHTISASLFSSPLKPGMLPPYPGSATFPGMDHSGPMFIPTYNSNHVFDLSNHNAPPTKSSSPPPARIYKPCVVCNDKSSGYHYGVSSCEGCKGFFRRSVQKSITYTCQKDSKCEINKVTRNRCQRCRLKKCFDNGMSKEAVRNDRKKKAAVTEHKDTAHKDTPNNADVVKDKERFSKLTERDSKLIDVILSAHRSTLPGGPILLVTKTKIAASPPSPAPSTASTSSKASDMKMQMCETSGSECNTQSPVTPASSTDSPERKTWDNLQELSSEGIIKVVDFAKKVPEWASITVGDQITLLKAACLEVMILRLAMRYDEEKDSLSFSSGAFMTRLEMEKGGFGQLAHAIFSFAASLKQLDLDDTGYALLSTICLLSSDRSGLEQSSHVETVQEPFLTALRHYCIEEFTSKPHFFAKLLMKLTDLRSISVKGADKVLHLRSDSSQAIPPLVVEMFDRKENVCLP